jgi:hypothetical protein
MDPVYVVDRFEGELAVLLGGDGSEFTVRRQLLPLGAREGSVLRVPMGAQGPDWSRAVLDDAERRRRDIEARDRLGRLKRRDPGGDIEL